MTLLTSVGLYLRGDRIDPTAITEALGTQASRGWRIGERFVTNSGRTGTRKNGLWCLRSDGDDPNIEKQVLAILDQLKLTDQNLSALEGVEEAELSVYVDCEDRIEFSIGHEALERLSSLGVFISFSTTCSRDEEPAREADSFEVRKPSMVRIFHNPRCSKSRQTLALLQENGVEPEVVEYLKTPPSAAEIRDLLGKLGVGAFDLMRRGEKVFKELGLSRDLGEDALVSAMAEHPILIERPIVVNGGKAALGRPPEAVLGIL